MRVCPKVLYFKTTLSFSMKGHNYNGICRKCGKTHKHPKGTLGKKGITQPHNPAHLFGAGNPFYKHGLWSREVQDFKEAHKFCMNCGNDKHLDIHHIDGDRHNNIATNLMVLCRSCHMKIDNRMVNLNGAD